MRYIEAITNRAQSDIDSLTAKAFFNIVDWQRIYNNSQVAKAIVDFLLSINVSFDELTEPSITTIPTVTEINTLLANIERIRDASGLPEINGISEIFASWQEGAGANAPDYLNVNEWEQILEYLVKSFPAMLDYQIYCGVASVGQIRFYQNKFRRLTYIPDDPAFVRRARTGISNSGVGLTRNNGFRRYA